MDMYKQAVWNELNQMLIMWEHYLEDPTATQQGITRMRLKIRRLVDILDKIEEMENKKP